ncbi:hypothetical protein BV20DRAFT_974906 [Pilatotrama ljubarskyi]|nr:hypothetical protein BV20DRAFT_974906 [Pilatotrama ljubarskyi]
MATVDQSDKDLLTSYLVSFFLDCLFFGVFSVAYAITIWLLLFNDVRRHLRNKRWDLTQAGLLTVMHMLAFTYVVLDVVVNVSAFAGDGGDLNAAIELFRVNNSVSLWGPKLGVLVTQTILGDAYLIYRLHVVWSRSFVVIAAPAFFLLCNIASGYAMVHYQIHPGDNQSVHGTNSLPRVMLILFFISSIVTNVLSTGLIAGRVISSKRSVRDIRIRPKALASRLTGVVDIIVQSAALYTCAFVVILATMFTAVKEPLVVLGFLPSLTGFAFALVVIRTRLSDAATQEVHRVDFRGNPRVVQQAISRDRDLSIHVDTEVISYDERK